MCRLIAGDEMRHHHAYSEFVNRIFQVDPSEMMLAFQYMMKQKIVMPAHFLRESGEKLVRLLSSFQILHKESEFILQRITLILCKN